MKGIKKILIPVDFSECSQQAFSYAIRIAKDSGAKLYLLHVIDVEFLDSVTDYGLGGKDDLRRMIENRTKKSFEEMLRKEEGAKKVDILQIVEEGIPFIQILKKARDIEVDIIVIGSSGTSSPLRRIFFGSTAEKVLRGTPVPVLCVPLPEVIET